MPTIDCRWHWGLLISGTMTLRRGSGRFARLRSITWGPPIIWRPRFLRFNEIVTGKGWAHGWSFGWLWWVYRQGHVMLAEREAVDV